MLNIFFNNQYTFPSLAQTRNTSCEQSKDQIHHIPPSQSTSATTTTKNIDSLTFCFIVIDKDDEKIKQTNLLESTE